MHQAALPHIERSLTQGGRRRALGLRARTATYFMSGMSFYLEILCGGHWHTKLSNLFSADVYSDKQISRRIWFCEVHRVRSLLSRRPWREENWRPWPALQETPCWIKALSKSWAASTFPVECSGKWLLSRSWALFSRERQNRKAWKTRRAVRNRTM